jgi:hypothetical protein
MNGTELRDALRQALGRFIDSDDDTMPALNRVDGGFTWVPADSALDDLMKVVAPLERMYLQAMADLGSALDAVDRVRSLHREQYGCCAHCTRADTVVHPCPTIKALDGLIAKEKA